MVRRATFSEAGLEVKVMGLQARNYLFTVQSLYKPINVKGCHVTASKTKKNILITLQVRPRTRATCAGALLCRCEDGAQQWRAAS